MLLIFLSTFIISEDTRALPFRHQAIRFKYLPAHYPLENLVLNQRFSTVTLGPPKRATNCPLAGHESRNKYIFISGPGLSELHSKGHVLLVSRSWRASTTRQRLIITVLNEREKGKFVCKSWN